MRLIFTLLMIPTCAFADAFPLLAGDAPLTRDEVVALTSAYSVEFYEGGRSHYSAGGSYSYTYSSGGNAYGQYEIGPDGIICITFRNGRARCDKFVRSHGRVVMITQSGDRFPLRPQ